MCQISINSEHFNFGTNLGIYCTYCGKYCIKIVFDIMWPINNWL